MIPGDNNFPDTKEALLIAKNFLYGAVSLCFLFVLISPASASSLDETADRLISNGGYCLTRNGQIYKAANPDRLFIPASILKIVTAYAALNLLGPEFRFQTVFYQDSGHNLYIKGYGDPFLISEEISLIMDNLKARGVKNINSIFLDTSSFVLSGGREDMGIGTSLNPYDAVNGALAVNYNTVNIAKEADGSVRSAEPQTPTIPLMAEVGRSLAPGIHRINISQSPDNVNRYALQLFRAFQKEKNIDGRGVLGEKTVPEGLEPFYVHRSSRNLEAVLSPLLLYSNNFIANQIFLTCGAQHLGYPATWEKASQTVNNFLHGTFGFSEDDLLFMEGSGISRKNRISPKAMISVLEAFRPYGRLLPQEEGHLLKSGTLKGVYSYAGYLKTRQGTDSFVIILNQQKNSRDALLDLLERMHRRDIS